jgi:hypothetical protein
MEPSPTTGAATTGAPYAGSPTPAVDPETPPRRTRRRHHGRSGTKRKERRARQALARGLPGRHGAERVAERRAAEGARGLAHADVARAARASGKVRLAHGSADASQTAGRAGGAPNTQKEANHRVPRCAMPWRRDRAGCSGAHASGSSPVSAQRSSSARVSTTVSPREADSTPARIFASVSGESSSSGWAGCGRAGGVVAMPSVPERESTTRCQAWRLAPSRASARSSPCRTQPPNLRRLAPLSASHRQLTTTGRRRSRSPVGAMTVGLARVSHPGSSDPNGN